MSESETLRLHRWTVAAIICQIADILTTHIALSRGFVEGNPVVQGIVEKSEYLMYGIKLGMIGILLVIATKRGYWWLAALPALAGAYAATINAFTIS